MCCHYDIILVYHLHLYCREYRNGSKFNIDSKVHKYLELQLDDILYQHVSSKPWVTFDLNHIAQNMNSISAEFTLSFLDQTFQSLLNPLVYIDV